MFVNFVEKIKLLTLKRKEKSVGMENSVASVRLLNTKIRPRLWDTKEGRSNFICINKQKSVIKCIYHRFCLFIILL
jgi:hypothetical protein